MTITLAGGASTNSRGKRPLPHGALSARTLATDGAVEAVEFTMADGKADLRRLLSWVGGQAGLLWGGPGRNLPPELQQAVGYRSHDVHGSYGHRGEWALADALGRALDGVFTSDSLACRFFGDGGVALAAAARLARHATGRHVVASSGYHGAAAEWAHRPNVAGVPVEHIDAHIQFRWGDYQRTWTLARECAAICVEVPAVPDDEALAFLAYCRQACDEGGAVFILDEVVTGFRLGLQGAAGYYGVKPDIACYGKAMCAIGGVSAVVGRADLVEPIGGDVFYSTTFGGNPGPCAVAAATVDYLREHPEAFEHLAWIGCELQAGYNALGIPCVGQPQRSVFGFDSDAQWLDFCSRMIARGVMVHRPNFPTLAHSLADVRVTLEAAQAVLAEGLRV